MPMFRQQKTTQGSLNELKTNFDAIEIHLENKINMKVKKLTNTIDWNLIQMKCNLLSN